MTETFSAFPAVRPRLLKCLVRSTVCDELSGIMLQPNRLAEQMKNKLCVILVSYNRREMLERAIQSIQQQTNKSFDLVVVENGSTDGSWDLIQATRWDVDGRVNLHRNSKNSQGTAATRRWTKLLEAPWATILCDDDWLGTNFVRDIVPHIPDQPTGLVVVGHARTDLHGTVLRICDHNTGVVDRVNALRQFEQKRIEVAGISGFAVPSRILQADVFPRNYPGGFCEDGMLCIQAIAEGGARCVSGVNYYRREWPGCESQRPDRLANEAIAYAMFARDIRQVLEREKIMMKPRLRWERRSLVSHLAYFARAVLLQKMPFSEFKRYYSFAKKEGTREWFRASLAASFFAVRYRPVVLCFKAFEDRRNQRLFSTLTK